MHFPVLSRVVPTGQTHCPVEFITKESSQTHSPAYLSSVEFSKLKTVFVKLTLQTVQRLSAELLHDKQLESAQGTHFPPFRGP